MNYLFANLVTGSSYPMMPVGTAYVAAALRQTGRYVTGISLDYYENPIEALLKKIWDEQIDVLCIGELSKNYPVLKNTISAVRKNCSHIKIIVGGGIITAEPEFIAQHLDMDFGCVGYGEETICELADCLETNGDFSKIKGLVFKNEANQVIITPRRPEPDNLDDIPFPALELFGFKGGKNQELRIVGSRSCTHNCTFCFHPSGYRYKERSLDNIFSEISYWKEKFKISKVEFSDELFGSNKERVLEFCRRFKKLGMKFTVQLRVDVVTEELIGALADSDCISIAYGIESMNQKVLDSMRKQITVEQVEAALMITRKYNVPIIGNIIFGDMIETYDMAKESLNWWFQNLHYGINLWFIAAYPGTALYRYGIKTGRIKDKLRFLEERCPVTNLSEMSDSEFAKLQRLVELMQKMSGEPVTNVRIEKQEDGDFLFGADCPNCGISNFAAYDAILNNAFSTVYQYCTKCGSKLILAQRFQEYLKDNYYFEEYDYRDKKIAVWGASPKTLFRLAANKRMRDAVVVVADLAYRRYCDNLFAGFSVCAPEMLSTINFDILYIGSRVSRKGILNMAKEILGDEYEKKEIMMMD